MSILSPVHVCTKSFFSSPVKPIVLFTDAEFSRWAAQCDTDEAEAPFEPSPLDSAEYLGFTLGADGVDAEPDTDDPEIRSAFRRGHDWGDAHLWSVDPAYASHLQEQAKRAHDYDAMMAADPVRDWSQCELIEAVGRTF